MASRYTRIIFTLLAVLCLTTTTFAIPTAEQPAQTVTSPTRTEHARACAVTARQNTNYNEQNPPPFNPPVTAAPTQEDALASLGWKQSTYYECRTRGGQERCGWHIPVYKAGAVERGSNLGLLVAGVVVAIGVVM
ncbi:hypothetical protein CEP52_011050 [Fusarium oligoseptatum]|uniref:Uncharacterized protein n=1 Tax=Fusarium oligoseptatum TaxID=2604345 RepID=A0A428T577_9HYPO|nr:hypothetical protein CEP52_011050 [Fusarium oligoseptatum]